MSYPMNLMLTALAPMIWGSTYVVTTQWLPSDYPITTAMLRALPAGLLMLAFLRQLPTAGQWIKIFVLGALNFTIFWICLFISAYRLPGGIAATLGAIQPLIVVLLAYVFFGQPLNVRSVLSASVGLVGVGLLILKPDAQLDLLGVIVAIIGALSMATGIVLSQAWRGDTPVLIFTSWQLTAGGLLLLPLSIFLEPAMPSLTIHNVLALLWLGLVGALLSYMIWFRGISILGSVEVSVLSFLSPVTAICLGWFMLEQHLTISQVVGVIIILLSIFHIHKRKSVCIR